MKFFDIFNQENKGKWFEVESEWLANGTLCRVTTEGTIQFKRKDCEVYGGESYTIKELNEMQLSDTPYRKPYTLLEALEKLKEAYDYRDAIPVFKSELKREDERDILCIAKDGECGVTYKDRLLDDDRYAWPMSVFMALGKWYLEE